MYIPLLLKHSDPLTQEELENHGLADFMSHEESLLDIDNILIDEFTTTDSSHEIEFTGNIENI
ncbi:MAG: hypothetical protein NWP47_00160 [Rickettsiaceae bacterium]|nr:hypothetical protein [Rickettsiaceae bacterium]